MGDCNVNETHITSDVSFNIRRYIVLIFSYKEGQFMIGLCLVMMTLHGLG